MKKDYHVVSYSGGKDSTAMLLLMLEHKMPIDRIIFIDLTKEYPDLYAHNEKVNRYLEQFNLRIESIKVDYDYWFAEHEKTKGKNKGKKGYGWPTPLIRWCTALKRSTVKKIVKEESVGKNVVEYHGIANDERERVITDDGRVIRYPLIDLGYTEKDCLEYCYSKGYDWNGLYRHLSRVSCYCCPLAKMDNLRSIYKYYPHLWKNMLDMDDKTDTRFKYNKTLRDLDNKFRMEKDNPQKNLF